MSKENLYRHYDEKYFKSLDPASTDVIRFTVAPSDRYEACINSFVNNNYCGDILEIGAGNGLIARSLLGTSLKINSYTVSEFTERGVQGLKNNVEDSRLRIIQLDAEMLPEEEYGKYDAVIMIALIEHLIDPLRAMQNIRMLLKPGGIVYINTPNIAKYTRRIKLLFGQFPSTASKDEGLMNYEGTPVDLYDEGHLHYFTFRSLSKMLIERCGFFHTEKQAHPSTRLFGKKIDYFLARLWPELFSEIVMIAHIQ
jgi:SAM-dependent methyltransferase